MADKGPNYAISRKKLELEIENHQDTIAKGDARLADIERAKKMNLRRVEVANLELDEEAAKINENKAALEGKIAEIQTNIDLMAKEK
ncbi:MAG: hypothetical protein ACOYB2_10515 [Limnohabitans sp.]